MDPRNSCHYGLRDGLPNVFLDSLCHFVVAGSFREGERDVFVRDTKDFNWEVLSDDLGL